MWRGILAAVIAYACGHPKLDGYRPAALNMPLQAFYQQINLAARTGQMALTSLSREHSRYVNAYMARAERQLRGAGITLAPASESPPGPEPSAPGR